MLGDEEEGIINQTVDAILKLRLASESEHTRNIGNKMEYQKEKAPIAIKQECQKICHSSHQRW